MDTCNYRFHFERDEGKNEEQNQKAAQVACVCVRASVSVHSPFCVLLLSIFLRTFWQNFSFFLEGSDQRL
jgi:hypothetical protein